METAEKINFLSALLPLALVIFIIAAGVVLLNQQFRKNLFRQKLAQEQLKSRYQRELLQSAIAAQEEERRRIARDLHDELGAILSITRMHLVQLEKTYATDPANTGAALNNIRQLTEASLANMRRISRQLMPLHLEGQDLAEALETLAVQVNATGSVQLNLREITPLPALGWPLKLAMYRILMELLNNTLTHAQAGEIEIQLDAAAGFLHCLYTDNGTGLPPGTVSGGLGHKNLEGRVSVLNGSLEMGNRPEGGFFARICIPLPGE
ncbi:MAG: hypothetical protein IBJ09_04315 [Bacteroidia bacterium]|nr:hypothetical protein [Bacteroidia bacterium]